VPSLAASGRSPCSPPCSESSSSPLASPAPPTPPLYKRVTVADIPARTNLKVTAGPIRGSRKIHVGPLGVAMRAVDLEPSCGEPPVTLYDTRGPYTDTPRSIH